MHPLLMTVLPFATLFTAHYGASHLYTTICVPLSVTGFFTSLITTASPICSGLLTVMTTTSQGYTLVIAGGITWFLSTASIQKVT
jgi:hypothetical protein